MVPVPEESGTGITMNSNLQCSLEAAYRKVVKSLASPICCELDRMREE